MYANGAGNSFVEDQISRYETEQSDRREVKQELDKDAFMELLMMEMKHQDPLEPMSNEQMMGQLAQFSSVEQLENLNNKFEGFMEAQMNTGWNQAFGFIGKNVRAMTEDGQIEGKISKATVHEDEIVFEVGGHAVTVDQIVFVFDNEEQTAE
ncbi:MAG: flagellar hook assembly protein FlgD [Candidatus Muiribacteriota bacterium]